MARVLSKTELLVTSTLVQDLLLIEDLTLIWSIKRTKIGVGGDQGMRLHVGKSVGLGEKLLQTISQDWLSKIDF